MELITAYCEKERAVNTNTEYLPGGIFSAIWGKWANYVVQEEIQADKFGQWNAFRLKIGYKEVTFIIVYRLPDRSGKGVKTVKVQLDESRGIKSTAKHRQDFVYEITEF